MNTKRAGSLPESRINSIKSWKQESFKIPEWIFLLILILIIPIFSCTNPNSSFYDKILNNFDTSSYFIALDVKSPYYKGRTIIENDNLYMYLHKSRGFDKEKYIDFMKSILSHHRALKIKDRDIVMQKFIKVDFSESVINNANHGSDYFIAKYFNGTVLNYVVTEKEQNAIINQLFFWNIPARIEKLTGALIIG